MPLVRLTDACASRLRSTTGGGTTGLAGAVDELVANALDAGASRIVVTLDAVHCALRVEDNGCGVPAGDVAFVGTRHATSKVASSGDLEAAECVRTLGFRGEALASLSGACVAAGKAR